MAKKNRQQSDSHSRLPWISLGVSVIAIAVSTLSWREANRARNLNYLISLPAISATVELTEPIQAGKPIIFKVVLENQGRTVAKQFAPELRFLLSAPSQAFKPVYSEVEGLGYERTAAKVSDLNPGARTALVSTNSLNLAHQHDVDAVASGNRVLYLYGKATYLDIEDKKHELHFCRLYQPVPGADPLKLKFCDSYNETVDG